MSLSSSDTVFHPIRTIDRPRTSDNKLARVTDYFGSNVFDLRAMRKRLSSQDVETLDTVMKFGGKIDSQLASRIATAVRRVGFRARRDSLLSLVSTPDGRHCRKA